MFADVTCVFVLLCMLVSCVCINILLACLPVECARACVCVFAPCVFAFACTRVCARVIYGSRRPVIDRVFAFGDVEAAHACMESNQNTGKILLAV